MRLQSRLRGYMQSFQNYRQKDSIHLNPQTICIVRFPLLHLRGQFFRVLLFSQEFQSNTESAMHTRLWDYLDHRKAEIMIPFENIENPTPPQEAAKSRAEGILHALETEVWRRDLHQWNRLFRDMRNEYPELKIGAEIIFDLYGNYCYFLACNQRLRLIPRTHSMDPFFISWTKLPLTDRSKTCRTIMFADFLFNIHCAYKSFKLCQGY